MKNKAVLTGDAKRKDKDAREKTSGLVDIGLITEDRLITEAGRKLLEITSSGDFGSNNVFNINIDSFIYLKQLLKTSIDASGSIVGPFIAVIKCLTELEFLNYDEFTYFVLLIRDDESEKQIISDIKLYREANLLPKKHAAGGYADIIYEYEACTSYPKHSLLLEETLADGNNQRRMEMEPVSRH